MTTFLKLFISYLQTLSQYPNILYFFGLGLQKGLPILTVPIIVNVFGSKTYGEYILIYTLVQVYANISSLAIPQAIVPLWFRQNESAAFIGLVMRMILALAFGFIPIGALCLIIWAADGIQLMHSWQLVSWVILFSLFYNFNAIGVNIARVRENRLRFFWAVAIGAFVLLAFFVIASIVGASSIHLLIFAQVIALIFSTVVLLWGRFHLKNLNCIIKWNHTVGSILRCSLPQCAYTLIVLFSMSIDKWVVKLNFNSSEFISYVLNYQFASALLFVPMVISMHNGPRVANLVTKGEFATLEIEDAKIRLVTIFGSFGIAVIMYGYGYVTGMTLTPGYWILVVGFICEGLYMLNSNRLMAELKTAQLMLSALLGATLLTIGLMVAAITKNIDLVYLVSSVYFVCLLVISMYQIRKLKHTNCDRGARRSQDV